MDRPLLSRARGHPVAAIVEDAAEQQSARGGPCHSGAITVRRKLVLHSFEQGSRDDRRVLCWIFRTEMARLSCCARRGTSSRSSPRRSPTWVLQEKGLRTAPPSPSRSSGKHRI